MMEAFEIAGRMVAMPVEVRRARNWIGTFTVPAGAARKLTEPTGLEIAEPRPGKAMVTLGFVEYDDTDLGAYHEFMVSIIVRRHDAGPATARQRSAEVRRSRVGVYVHRLPVDDRFSMEAGRGIWGYPKTLMEFERRDEGRATEWTLREHGATVLAMRFRPRWFPIPRQAAPVTYTLLDGVLRMTPWESRPRGIRGRPGGVDLTLGEGEMADELRSLGLPKRALLGLSVSEMRARFQAPRVIERASGSSEEESRRSV